MSVLQKHTTDTIVERKPPVPKHVDVIDKGEWEVTTSSIVEHTITTSNTLSAGKNLGPSPTHGNQEPILRIVLN